MCEHDKAGNAFINILLISIATGIGVGMVLNGLIHNSDLSTGIGILSGVGLVFYLMHKVEL